MDDGRGTFLPGAIESTGAVQGVQGGYGRLIDGRSHEETTWARGRGEMGLYNLVHEGRTADVLHGLLVQGRPAELPG